MSDFRIIEGDCIEAMAAMDEASVDAIVTDPPYGLGFMGKKWDSSFAPADQPMRRNGPQDAVNAGASRQGGRQRAGADYQRRMARDSREFQAWSEAWATEALRVLKPGGHLLAFGGTRTYHRLACAIEDAGFEIRDCLAWLYGSGFPKSLDVSKAIDKAAGAERETVGRKPVGWGGLHANDRLNDDGWNKIGTEYPEGQPITAPATPEAAEWEGWGTALKPAHEPIVLARKPLTGTVAANVLANGTGALNVDGCRIDLNGGAKTTGGCAGKSALHEGGIIERAAEDNSHGRWPANVVLDPEAAAMLDEQSGERPGNFATRGESKDGQVFGFGNDRGDGPRGYGDTGGASRFFYVAKASRAERGSGNAHPTVKPIELMRWLVRLVTPPGGTVLDPFLGSGTTGIAALREGFDFIGCEREPEYVAIARQRIYGDAPLLNVEMAA